MRQIEAKTKYLCPFQEVGAGLEGGAPGETRTPDPLLRRQLLYPIELPAQ